MAKELATKKQNAIEVIIGENKQDLKNLLPSHVNGERFIKSAMLAAYKNPDILKCDKVSVMAAIYTGAELGLDFTEAKGHAYIVPFGSKATFIPGYRGLIDLARRSGAVNKIEAHVVYDNDEFEVEYGTASKIFHKPVIDGGPQGKVIGAYAVAWMKTGETQCEFMNLEELNKIRNKSKSKSGPWATDTGEMYRKTVVRRLFKYLPSSPDMEKALEKDNDAFDNLAPTPAPPIVEPTPPPLTPATVDPAPTAEPKTTANKTAAKAEVTEVF